MYKNKINVCRDNGLINNLDFTLYELCKIFQKVINKGQISTNYDKANVN